MASAASWRRRAASASDSILLLARETLELARLRLPSAARGRAGPDRPTRPTDPSGADCRPCARARSFSCCCARGELAQLLRRLVDLVVGLLLLLLLLAALHGLVLIAQLVLLQLEDVGEILRVGADCLRHRRRRPLPPIETWISRNTASARCSCCSARCSGCSADDGDPCVSFFSAVSISAAAFGRISRDLLPALSPCAMPRSTSRLASWLVCSRSRCCDSRSVARFSSSDFLSVCALSRAVLNVAAMISRCVCESWSASSCWPPPPPPPPPPPCCWR